MNKDALYSEMITMVPVKSGNDFRKVVRDALNNYVTKINELDMSDRPATWNQTLTRLSQLCDGINRAIDCEYKGLRHSAYASIKNQLDGYSTRRASITGLAYNRNIKTIGSDYVSYRMRKVPLEEQKDLKEKDLFHIPLDKRTLVKTQRYSVPGYPCLYLSHRVYGCWEEMGRPDFGTIMVSAFKSTDNFNVLDIRIPTKDSWNGDMERCILFFPLVISTMVQVNNTSDPYKPEYTIPQILTEWVISHNRDRKPSEPKILGIAYSSAQKNNDFDYPEDSYDNYAIPVLNPLSSKKYCKRLCKLFHVTRPTYYDLEALRQGKTIGGGTFGLTDEKQRIENIRISNFGEMERYLSTYDFNEVTA